MTVPRVTLTIEHEAVPRIVIEAESKADEEALRAWVRTCRPDIEAFLKGIAIELHHRKKTA